MEEFIRKAQLLQTAAGSLTGHLQLSSASCLLSVRVKTGDCSSGHVPEAPALALRAVLGWQLFMCEVPGVCLNQPLSLDTSPVEMEAFPFTFPPDKLFWHSLLGGFLVFLFLPFPWMHLGMEMKCGTCEVVSAEQGLKSA